MCHGWLNLALNLTRKAEVRLTAVLSFTTAQPKEVKSNNKLNLPHFTRACYLPHINILAVILAFYPTEPKLFERFNPTPKRRLWLISLDLHFVQNNVKIKPIDLFHTFCISRGNFGSSDDWNKYSGGLSTNTCQAVSDVSCSCRDTHVILWTDPIISPWPARPSHRGDGKQIAFTASSFFLRFDYDCALAVTGTDWHDL